MVEMMETQDVITLYRFRKMIETFKAILICIAQLREMHAKGEVQRWNHDLGQWFSYVLVLGFFEVLVGSY